MNVLRTVHHRLHATVLGENWWEGERGGGALIEVNELAGRQKRKRRIPGTCGSKQSKQNCILTSCTLERENCRQVWIFSEGGLHSASAVLHREIARTRVCVCVWSKHVLV